MVLGEKGFNLGKPALQKRIESEIALLRKTPRLFPPEGGSVGIKVWSKWQSSLAGGNTAEISLKGNCLLGDRQADIWEILLDLKP